MKRLRVKARRSTGYAHRLALATATFVLLLCTVACGQGASATRQGSLDVATDKRSGFSFVKRGSRLHVRAPRAAPASLMRALRTKRLAYGCGSAEKLSFDARRGAPLAVLATFPSAGAELTVDLPRGTPGQPAFCRIQGNQLTPVAIAYFAPGGRRIAVEEDTVLLLEGRRLALQPRAKTDRARWRLDSESDLSAECRSFPLPGSYGTRGRVVEGTEPPTVLLRSDIADRIGSCMIRSDGVTGLTAYFASSQELFGRVAAGRIIRSCGSVAACQLENY